jgi:diguanylate cyclase (GGDEF)-like protein
VISLEAFLMTIADRLHPARDVEGAHRVAAQDRRDDRSAHRPAQPPRLPAGRPDLLQQQIARDRPIGVLLVDLDHFKSINDRFGHTSATRCCRSSPGSAQANLRQADLVGRLGGEEFVVVLADASIDNAYLVADRLRNAFAVGAAVIDDQALHATASIGVSVIVDPAQDLARLITLADQALYLAKAPRAAIRVEVAPLGIDLGERGTARRCRSRGAA